MAKCEKCGSEMRQIDEKTVGYLVIHTLQCSSDECIAAPVLAFSQNRPLECGVCKGLGYIGVVNPATKQISERVNCDYCHGTGFSGYHNIRECHGCHGNGRKGGVSEQCCDLCQGAGFVDG